MTFDFFRTAKNKASAGTEEDMTRTRKKATQVRGARLFIATLAMLAALLASCENLITRTPPADVGGGVRA